MVDHQVAGYKKKFENDFTFATVRAAGHEVRTRPAAVAKEDQSGMSLMLCCSCPGGGRCLRTSLRPP
jgi:hypothetical protein